MQKQSLKSGIFNIIFNIKLKIGRLVQKDNQQICPLQNFSDLSILLLFFH